MEFQYAAAGQPQGLAAAEGGFSGQERLKVNAASAVIINNQFIVAKLQTDIEGRFPAGAENAHRCRGPGPVTAV